MSDLVQVIFRAHSAPFNAGEIAAVTPARAEALIHAGVAEEIVAEGEAPMIRVKPAPQPEADSEAEGETQGALEAETADAPKVRTKPAPKSKTKAT